ncbi:MAG: PAS domain S-box protein [Lentisphaerae bacterium]|nr:PAS domain S-box protein [Lentisphaerota bacterium]
MKKDALSRTMRIDLIPAAPSEPVSGKKQRVVVAKAPGGRRPHPDARETAEDSPYRRLLQGVYDAAVVTDLEGRVTDVNVRAIEFLQYGRAELLNLSIFDIISGADPSLIETLWKNLKKERFTLIQAYCVRKDGTMFPAEIAVNKIRLQAMHLCFFIRDITLRRQAEEMLRIEHSAIQNAGNGIAVADLEARLEYVNPAVGAMWGYEDIETLLGKDVRELLADRAAANRMLDALLRDGASWSGEITARGRDGKTFDVQVSAACNRNADGELDGLVLSFQDVSDRKRAAAAERESERRRVMLESLGAACHHLGQPATILMGNMGMIKKRAPAGDTALQELVGSSLEASRELGRILHKLNAVNEYKTTQYLASEEGDEGEEHRILEI